MIRTFKLAAELCSVLKRLWLYIVKGCSKALMDRYALYNIHGPLSITRQTRRQHLVTADLWKLNCIRVSDRYIHFSMTVVILYIYTLGRAIENYSSVLNIELIKIFYINSNINNNKLCNAYILCKKLINKYTGRNTFHLRINGATTIIYIYIRFTWQIYKDDKNN